MDKSAEGVIGKTHNAKSAIGFFLSDGGIGELFELRFQLCLGRKQIDGKNKSDCNILYDCVGAGEDAGGGRSNDLHDFLNFQKVVLNDFLNIKAVQIHHFVQRMIQIGALELVVPIVDRFRNGVYKKLQFSRKLAGAPHNLRN